ncbi:MAG: hypothetical protein V3T65_08170 [Acidobacteriota bacterium]
MFSQRKRAALFLVLVFLCGLLAGAVATNLWVDRGPGTVRFRMDSPSSSRRQRAVERFTGRLNLTPEQATQLNQILDEVRDTYQEQESVIERLRQEAPARIREILDDEQKTEFDEMLSRGDRRRRRRERDRDD